MPEKEDLEQLVGLVEKKFQVSTLTRRIKEESTPDAQKQKLLQNEQAEKFIEKMKEQK